MGFTLIFIKNAPFYLINIFILVLLPDYIKSFDNCIGKLSIFVSFDTFDESSKFIDAFSQVDFILFLSNVYKFLIRISFFLLRIPINKIAPVKPSHAPRLAANSKQINKSTLNIPKAALSHFRLLGPKREKDIVIGKTIDSHPPK